MSRDYRARQKSAAAGVRKMTASNTNHEKIMQSAEGRSEMNTYRLAKVRPVITRSHYAPKVMKLQLTLDLRDIRGEDLSALKKYGDVTENISRTVFVPAGMPLHALHYLINQAFGWQNSHLHNFELPEDIRDVLTEMAGCLAGPLSAVCISAFRSRRTMNFGMTITRKGSASKPGCAANIAGLIMTGQRARHT